MKKYLLGLLVGFVGITSFCSALNVSDLIEPIISRTTTTIENGQNSVVHQVIGSDNYGTYCVKLYGSDGHGFFGMSNSPSFFTEGWSSTFFSDWSYPLYICTYTNLKYLIFHADGSDITVDYELFKLNALLNTEVPKLTSSECQSEYDLIPISSVDQNYCVNNDLCPFYYLHINQANGDNESSLISSDLNIYTSSGILVDSSSSPLGNFYFTVDSSYTGGICELGSGNWSALYINGIQHESAGLIDINIADYVPRDYSINEDVFDLDIGSGYDQDYIDGVIDVQSYRPTSEDFTQTFVGGLILFTPYIVILLFVILVWNLIKKIFKTK